MKQVLFLVATLSATMLAPSRAIACDDDDDDSSESDDDDDSDQPTAQVDPDLQHRVARLQQRLDALRHRFDRRAQVHVVVPLPPMPPMAPLPPRPPKPPAPPQQSASGWNLDIDLDLPEINIDIDLPDFDLKIPDLKIPKIQIPKLDKQTKVIIDAWAGDHEQADEADEPDEPDESDESDD